MPLDGLMTALPGIQRDRRGRFAKQEPADLTSQNVTSSEPAAEVLSQPGNNPVADQRSAEAGGWLSSHLPTLYATPEQSSDLGIAPPESWSEASKEAWPSLPLDVQIDCLVLAAAAEAQAMPADPPAPVLSEPIEPQRVAPPASTVEARRAAFDLFMQDPRNVFLPLVEPTMWQLLEAGHVQRTGDVTTDLRAAYAMACQMHPAITAHMATQQRAAVPLSPEIQREQEAVARARAASRSLGNYDRSSG